MQGGLRENHASYSTVVFKQEHLCVIIQHWIVLVAQVPCWVSSEGES